MVTAVNQKSEAISPRRRGRPRAFVMEAVLAAATAVFWQFGYEGTSINDLTAAMGITAQSLYAAFGSKLALYERCLHWYLENVSAYTGRALAEEADAIDAISRMLLEVADRFSQIGSPHGCMVTTDLLRCAVEHEEVSATVARLRSRSIEEFKERIDLGIKQQQIRQETNSSVLARFIGAMIQGMSIQARDGAKQNELRELATVAIGCLGPYRLGKH